MNDPVFPADPPLVSQPERFDASVASRGGLDASLKEAADGSIVDAQTASVTWRSIPSSGSLGFASWSSRSDLEGGFREAWVAELSDDQRTQPVLSFDACGPGCEVARLGVLGESLVGQPGISTHGPSGETFLGYTTPGRPEPQLNKWNTGFVMVSLTRNRVVAGLLSVTAKPPTSGEDQPSCRLGYNAWEPRALAILDRGNSNATLTRPFLRGAFDDEARLRLTGWYLEDLQKSYSASCYGLAVSQDFPLQTLVTCGPDLSVADDVTGGSTRELAENELGWGNGPGFGSKAFVTKTTSQSSSDLFSYAMEAGLQREASGLKGKPCYVAVGDRYLAYYSEPETLQTTRCETGFRPSDIQIRDRSSGVERVVDLGPDALSIARYIRTYGSFVAGMVERPVQDYQHLLVRAEDGAARLLKNPGPSRQRIDFALDREYLWILARPGPQAADRLYRYRLTMFEQIGEAYP